jgi:hypothetical protein
MAYRVQMALAIMVSATGGLKKPLPVLTIGENGILAVSANRHMMDRGHFMVLIGANSY